MSVVAQAVLREIGQNESFTSSINSTTSSHDVTKCLYQTQRGYKGRGGGGKATRSVTKQRCSADNGSTIHACFPVSYIFLRSKRQLSYFSFGTKAVRKIKHKWWWPLQPFLNWLQTLRYPVYKVVTLILPCTWSANKILYKTMPLMIASWVGKALFTFHSREYMGINP